MDRYLIVFKSKKPDYVDCDSLVELGRHIESKYGKSAKIKYIQRISLEEDENKWRRCGERHMP